VVVEGAEFADYFWPAAEQLIELSHESWRSCGKQVPNITIRLASGGYIGGGLYHSQNLEGFLTTIPGIRVVVPAFADDAAGLLRTSIRSRGVTMFLEPKFLYNAAQAKALTALVIAEAGGPGKEGSANKAFVGKSPQFLGKAIGVEVPAGVKLLFCEAAKDDPLVWTEQLMPYIPLVRMRSADEAIDFAVQVEHGNRHSAMMHSHDIERLSRMARAMNCSLFVKNGPCYAGLGQGGAGYTSFTIASPTGEGITRARTFTRERRCTLVDSFRII